ARRPWRHGRPLHDPLLGPETRYLAPESTLVPPRSGDRRPVPGRDDRCHRVIGRGVMAILSSVVDTDPIPSFDRSLEPDPPQEIAVSVAGTAPRNGKTLVVPKKDGEGVEIRRRWRRGLHPARFHSYPWR